LASKLFTAAKATDDFIIDRLLQPAINAAEWVFGIPRFTLAKVSLVIGGGVGLIWLHQFDPFPSAGFYQDMLCLVIMLVATALQIRLHEKREPKRAALMPAIRATGLLWRTAWLFDLAVFPFQWPIEAHRELACNFIWTFFVVLPYWIICCRPPPPPAIYRERALARVSISAR
jgi:hypothetical protein